MVYFLFDQMVVDDSSLVLLHLGIDEIEAYSFSLYFSLQVV